ncbi:MAG TPA: Sec-independent protein translocase subunit TatA [Mycobacteriales bacterium]|jgi:sec-independent protein translocase protein TatA|nr:Sec-independent protein translocase subunit TatA [Mycobacteriales bacterium]
MDIGWPEIAIIAAVILVLFGSKKLPDAARSLGKSMRIMKTEIKGLHDDEPPAAPAELSTAKPVNAEPVSAEQTTSTS